MEDTETQDKPWPTWTHVVGRLALIAGLSYAAFVGISSFKLGGVLTGIATALVVVILFIEIWAWRRESALAARLSPVRWLIKLLFWGVMLVILEAILWSWNESQPTSSFITFSVLAIPWFVLAVVLYRRGHTGVKNFLVGLAYIFLVVWFGIGAGRFIYERVSSMVSPELGWVVPVSVAGGIILLLAAALAVFMGWDEQEDPNSLK